MRLPETRAGRFFVGVSAGPAIGFNSDFNNQNRKNSFHFNVGLDTLYEMDCPSGKFCKGLFIESNFDLFLSSRYDFGATTVSGTGLIGNFTEKVESYAGSVGLRKQFLKENHFQFFVALGLGISHIRIKEFSFRDSLGNDLNLSISRSSNNFSINPAIGLSYKISHKLMFDLGLKWHFLIPQGLNNAFLEIPLGIKYIF